MPLWAVATSEVPSDSVTVPLRIVPPDRSQEPVLAVKANVFPVLSRVPVRFTVPPLRVSVPKPAVVKLPPKLRIDPLSDRAGVAPGTVDRQRAPAANGYRSFARQCPPGRRHNPQPARRRPGHAAQPALLHPLRNGTWYAATTNLYRTTDLAKLETPSASWTYDDAYVSGAHRGTATAIATNGASPIQVPSTGRTCSLSTMSVGGSDALWHGWVTESGRTNIATWAAALNNGGMQVDFIDPIGTPEYLQLKHKDTTAPARFSGSWSFKVNESDTTDTVATLAGTAVMSSQLMGHEQVTIGSHSYLTAKLQYTLTMTATGDFTYNGHHYTNCPVTITETATLWCDPVLGPVKILYGLTVRATASGLGTQVTSETATLTLHS